MMRKSSIALLDRVATVRGAARVAPQPRRDRLPGGISKGLCDRQEGERRSRAADDRCRRAGSSAPRSASRIRTRYGVVQDAGVHRYVSARRPGAGAGQHQAEPAVDVHRARHRRRQRVRGARRLRAHHARRAGADQERSGAGRRARRTRSSTSPRSTPSDAIQKSKAVQMGAAETLVRQLRADGAAPSPRPTTTSSNAASAAPKRTSPTRRASRSRTRPAMRRTAWSRS